MGTFLRGAGQVGVEGWRPTSGRLAFLDLATLDDPGLSDPEAHVDRAVLICIEGSAMTIKRGSWQHRLAKHVSAVASGGLHQNELAAADAPEST